MSPDPRQIGELIREIYRSGLVHGEDGADYPIENTSVTPERGRFIGDLCRAENATATIEIGMAWGLSTLFLLEALAANGAPPRAHLVSDPFQSSRWHGAALRSIREAGAAEMIEFYEEPSEMVLPRMVTNQRVFDFAFIDGNHRFDAVFVDMIFVNRLLRPGGVMVLDDAWFDPVDLACRFAETNLGYIPVAEFPKREARARGSRTTREGPLMRALRKPAVEPQRDIFHFVPFFDRIDTGLRTEEKRLRDEGMRALRRGDRAGARRALVGAFRLNPCRVNTWMRALRTFLPVRISRSISGREYRTGANPPREIR